VGFLSALIVLGVIGAVFYAFSRGGGGYEELGPAVVDTPTAGMLNDAEAAGFTKICDEVVELTIELLEGFGEVADLLDEERTVEAAERFSAMDDALEQLPEVAAQGDEFEGGSVEPKWWSDHVRELAERLLEVDARGKIASAEGGMAAQGVAEAGLRLVGEIALSSEDFARRMLGFDLVAQVRERRGKDAAKMLKAAVDEAQARMG
jgi:hypothetical protein